jgi:hypothetical protein
VTENQMNERNEKDEKLKSRRALLAATVGGAAAALAATAAAPASVLAGLDGDVVLGATNSSATTTEIDASAANVDAFKGTATGTGSGVVATSVNGPAVDATATGTGSAVGASAADGPAVIASKSAPDTTAVVYATSGTTGAATLDETPFTGVYGFTETDPEILGTGVWGDSADVGVYGSGGTGTIGYGFWGVYGESASPGGIGIYAFASSTDRRALYVDGKVGFRRSGKATISAGHSSIVVNLTGVSASSMVFAQIASNRSGRWVRAVVPTTGKFTVYLNTTVTAATFVIWWVIN